MKMTIPFSSLRRRTKSATKLKWHYFTSKRSTTSTKLKTIQSLFRHDSIFMNKQKTYLNNLSLSQVAGHTSFIMSISAFAATDILDLRCLAISATSLSMLFQYYRPIPLKIPLQWNTLVLGINFIMASLLYIERKNADNMDPYMEQLYHQGNFGKRCFSRVEFCKLFSKSKYNQNLKEGEILMVEGTKNSTMYFLVSGSVVVKSGKKELATITEHGFVGEMSFLDVLAAHDNDTIEYEQEHEHDHNRHDDKKSDSHYDHDHDDTIATADVIVGPGGATVYEWDFHELLDYLQSEHEVANALQAFISHDLREKLKASNLYLIQK